MALFTLTIDDQPPDFGGGHPSGERQQIVALLRAVAEKLGDGVSLEGEIPDPMGRDRDPDHIGHWTYTPVAGVPPPEPPVVPETETA